MAEYMHYAGGPAGLTGTAQMTCPACGWIGRRCDAPLHDRNPDAEADR